MCLHIRSLIHPGDDCDMTGDPPIIESEDLALGPDSVFHYHISLFKLSTSDL